jgi:CHAT domain-containing protein/tetratricopeptide (TPR) repeat protein
MHRSQRTQAWWMLALGLSTVASGSACRGVDPETLFAEAEQLRLAYEKAASEKAILKYHDARDAWAHAGDSARAATVSRMLGTTHEQLGRLQEALSDYLEAESLCQESCDPLLESAIASDIGLTAAMFADNDESRGLALARCERALNKAREAGGLREEAKALNCAGEVEYHRGNLAQALELYLQAKPLWESVADARGQAETLFYEGTVRSDLSQLAAARTNLDDALSLWRSSGDKRGEAMALVALGRLEHRLGRYQHALNRFREALELLEPLGDLVWEVSGRGGIGAVYFDMGNGAGALSYWEPALEPVQKIGIPAATWDLFLHLGRTHLMLEDPSRALHRFHESLELAQKNRSDWQQAYSLLFMGTAHVELEEPEEALEALDRALLLQGSARDPRLEAAIQAQMGNAFELLGRHAKASESFRRAADLSKDSSDRIGEAVARFGLARVARSQSDLDAARGYIESSLRVAESLRLDVASLELRTSYFASIFQLHELYVDVLMGLHEIHPRNNFSAAAFEASERGRARSLLDSLTEAGVDIRVGVAPALLEKEAFLRRRLEVEGSDRMVQSEHELVEAEIRSRSPLYSTLVQPKPLDLEEVQKELDDDTVLLEYALGEERSFLWAVSKHEYASFELPPRPDIEGEARRLYELLTTQGRVEAESLQERKRRFERADHAYWEAATRFSEVLLGPVEDKIAGKRIVVVTDGALQYLPFAALLDPLTENEPLIVAHEIVNLPSASALAVLRKETLGRESPKATLAVFADPVFTRDDPRLVADSGSGMRQILYDSGLRESGDLRIPRLEGTRQEARAIVDLAPAGTTFEATDFAATRSEALRAELGHYRIVHFATHGVSNTDDPAMSGIYLSMFDAGGEAQDGFLRLHDIYDLNLSADLVVLSACSTALGKQIRGEGIVGIVRGFLYAGARSVVASLWKVDDEATRELMRRFYREMLVEHRPRSAALRIAQVSMWRETKWRSPFFWAAFVLQGEWREGG